MRALCNLRHCCCCFVYDIVVELRNPNAKLRTNEVPVHAEDGGNMEYADDVQDSDYHSEEGSDEILPDDNQLDSDADVSDDDVDVGTRSRRAKQTTAKKTSKKQGSSNAAAAAADPGISEQQQEPSVISPQGAGIMPPTSAAVSPSAPGQPPLGMLFIPTAALGTPASAAGHSSPKQPAVAEGDTAAPKRRLSGSTAELPIKRRCEALTEQQYQFGFDTHTYIKAAALCHHECVVSVKCKLTFGMLGAPAVVGVVAAYLTCQANAGYANVTPVWLQLKVHNLM